MCVAAVAWNAHPDWLLVAIGNRDEYHERPTAPLARWDDEPAILAGRDLRSGGTWLGVSAGAKGPDGNGGRFVLVTNLRGHGDPDPFRVSRGGLATDILAGRAPVDAGTASDFSAYNPFNVIAADRRGAMFLSNRPEAIRAPLAHGIYGLSNGTLDEPWPKTLQLKAALVDWLGGEARDPDGLFPALAADHLGDWGIGAHRPSDVAAEAIDTPVFIADPVYGTRCSTVVAIAHDGTGTIRERRFGPDAEEAGEDSIAFAWD